MQDLVHWLLEQDAADAAGLGSKEVYKEEEASFSSRSLSTVSAGG